MIWKYLFSTARTSKDYRALLTCRHIYNKASRIAFEIGAFELSHKYWTDIIYGKVSFDSKLKSALSEDRRGTICNIVFPLDNLLYNPLLELNRLMHGLYSLNIKPEKVTVHHELPFKDFGPAIQ
jgi:hypothetical protein